METGQEDY